MAFLSPDKRFHAMDSGAHYGLCCVENLYWHLLKYHDILAAAAGKLPRLATIETIVTTEFMDVVGTTRVKATIRDGTLWADWNEFYVECPLDYTQRDWSPYDAELELSEDGDGAGSPGWNDSPGSTGQESDFESAPYSSTSPMSGYSE